MPLALTQCLLAPLDGIILAFPRLGPDYHKKAMEHFQPGLART